MIVRVTPDQERDINAIAAWLIANVTTVQSQQQALAWAVMVIQQPGYDRAQPIPNNRIAGCDFDMPAPAAL